MPYPKKYSTQLYNIWINPTDEKKEKKNGIFENEFVEIFDYKTAFSPLWSDFINIKSSLIKF